MSDKIYVPKSSAKEKKFDNGGSIIKLGFKADELVAFINQHKNSRGYINFSVGQRRTPSQYGDTHSVALDQFEPKQSEGAPAPRAERPVDSDEVPF